MADTLAQDVRSFITFALALKPAQVIQQNGNEHSASLTLKISASDQLSETEIASLEPLMAKYVPLKPYLDALLKSEISVSTSTHSVNFKPNVHYRLVRITEEQYRIAKEVAARLERIHVAHAANDLRSAKSEYDGFHEFLAQKRSALIGEFKGIQFTNAVASYGVDAVGADFVGTQVVVFVVIEIFVS